MYDRLLLIRFAQVVCLVQLIRSAESSTICPSKPQAWSRGLGLCPESSIVDDTMSRIETLSVLSREGQSSTKLQMSDCSFKAESPVQSVASNTALSSMTINWGISSTHIQALHSTKALPVLTDAECPPPSSPAHSFDVSWLCILIQSEDDTTSCSFPSNLARNDAPAAPTDVHSAPAASSAACPADRPAISCGSPPPPPPLPLPAAAARPPLRRAPAWSAGLGLVPPAAPAAAALVIARRAAP
jgi:hypothetical protein